MNEPLAELREEWEHIRSYPLMSVKEQQGPIGSLIKRLFTQAEAAERDNERLTRNVETANMDAYLRGKERDALQARVAALEEALKLTVSRRNFEYAIQALGVHE